MGSLPLVEIIGYAASLLVAISLMMSSILRLRIINLVGSLFFTAYGLLIQAYPVAAVNFFIVLINIYYLVEMFRAREFFRLLQVRPDSEYLGYFLNYHAKDIERFQPGFSFSTGGGSLVFFILRNVIPAGLVIGELRAPDSLYIHLDYAIPGYRDLRTSQYLFRDSVTALREKGIRQVFSSPGSPAHQEYLRKMGFAPETAPDGESIYCLKLS